MTDRPTIAERYIRAAKSSHLEVKGTACDVDYLIAAGLASESLATRLIRLRADFDAVSSQGGTRIMLKMLRGYSEAVAALMAFGMEYAGRRLPPEEQILDVVSRTLDLYIDPNCPICDGRGFSGSYGAPTVRCSSCRESGKRLAYWKDDRQEEFAAWLQSSMEAKVTRTLDAMRRLLRQR